MPSGRTERERDDDDCGTRSCSRSYVSYSSHHVIGVGERNNDNKCQYAANPPPDGGAHDLIVLMASDAPCHQTIQLPANRRQMFVGNLPS